MLVTELCPTLCDLMDNSPQGSSLHAVLQARILGLWGIFPAQESNPGLLHSKQTLYHLSHQGSPEYGDLLLILYEGGLAVGRRELSR